MVNILLGGFYQILKTNKPLVNGGTVESSTFRLQGPHVISCLREAQHFQAAFSSRILHKDDFFRSKINKYSRPTLVLQDTETEQATVEFQSG